MSVIDNTKVFVLKQIDDVKAYGIKELFRKIGLIKQIIVNAFLDVIAIVPCLIIRLIAPLITIRIHNVPASNFGCFAHEVAIYYCKKKFNIDQPNHRYIDLLYISYKDKKIYNRQLAKMWKRKLIFFPSYLLEPINRVNKLFPNWKKHTINTLDHMERDIDNYIEKCQPLDFTSKEENYGKKILSKFGLRDNDKYVCLAVRDGAYSKKKIPSRFRDWSYQDYRNCDIDNFMPAAEELTRRGYYVFRMGVVVNKALNSKNPKIIDYAKSNLRSDFMDIYLGAKCSFCVSTAHGFDAFVYIFRRPIVMLGSTLGDLKTHSENFLLMTKHYFLKKEKRNLSLSETFSRGLAFAFDGKTYEKNGIKILDNSPEEIKDMVIEMDECLKDNKKLSHEEEQLQKTFKDLYAANLKRYSDQIPLIRMHGQIRSLYSTQFLKKNSYWLR